MTSVYAGANGAQAVAGGGGAVAVAGLPDYNENYSSIMNTMSSGRVYGTGGSEVMTLQRSQSAPSSFSSQPGSSQSVLVSSSGKDTTVIQQNDNQPPKVYRISDNAGG